MGETAPGKWDKNSEKYNKDKRTIDWVLGNMETELTQGTNQELRDTEEKVITGKFSNSLKDLRTKIKEDHNGDKKADIADLWDKFHLRQTA